MPVVMVIECAKDNDRLDTESYNLQRCITTLCEKEGHALRKNRIRCIQLTKRPLMSIESSKSFPGHKRERDLRK